MPPQFNYQVVRRGAFHRTTSIRINPNGEVIVRAPSWLPAWEIEHFVKSKSDWITKQLIRYKNQPEPINKNFTEGELHPLLGSDYPLKITKLPFINRCRLKFADDSFQAIVPDNFTTDEQKQSLEILMLKLYLEHGQRAINEKVYNFTKMLGVTYNRITLKKVSSIWGSCSRANNLNFNRKLVLAPHSVIDYVVIHEVCHLIHRHHRESFWDLVKSLCPEYKSHVRWLKNNQHLLSI